MSRSVTVSYELRVFVGLIALVVLICAPALHASLDEPILSWHTNMGSESDDLAEGIAVDGSGNIYVAGWTESTWGTPIHPYAGGRDAFVAKLNSSGERLWHTFMGSSGTDEALTVAVDGDGYVYVTGTSDASWGIPLHAHAGGDDGFAVKLNSDGVRQWHTFMGRTPEGLGGDDGNDWGRSIAVDTNGTVYVAGVGSCGIAPHSWCTDWVDPPQGSWDVWVTKLSADGVRQWHTFLGSVDTDWVRSIAVDGDSNIYVAGRSDADWGSPVHPYAGTRDALLAKLNTSGELLWHTFMGSENHDYGMGLAVDGSGNVYFSGSSSETWGTPINPGASGFAAKLNSSGERLWHTFLGSEGVGYAWGLAIDESRNIFVGSWYENVQLSPNGSIQRHFTIPHGGSGAYQPIAVDTRGNVYFGGGMDEDWWIEPVPETIVPWSGGWDACVVKFQILLFADGFESGDTSWWSSTVP